MSFASAIKYNVHVKGGGPVKCELNTDRVEVFTRDSTGDPVCWRYTVVFSRYINKRARW